ncbi:YkoP family protein [Cytobacillus oceanisediminis]|uniref:YkoP family protein n=1 Tax=Cytobacillus oceanisediminis TaxID=665099 RepID=UPI0037356E87
MMVRSILLIVWGYLDPIYFPFTRLQYPASDQEREGVFRVRLTKYKGKDLELSDGIIIRKNDLLLKIHLHNVKLLNEFNNIKSELSKGRGIFKRVKESMPVLTTFILKHPEEAKIKGIIGITLINKGFSPLGFECILPENKLYCWFKKTFQLPIFLLSCSKISVANVKRHRTVYLMMSKEKLIEKYKQPS